MITIEKHDRHNIFVLTPAKAITSDDIAQLNRQINDYINAHDKVPNLVLRAERVPVWENFEALTDHIKFVRNHHRLVKKVAIVSDAKLVWLVRPVVDSFTGAKVRRFSADAFDKAYAWAKKNEDDPGEFGLIKGLPSDVVAVAARGTITAQDYRDVLEPAVREKLKRHDKLKLLFLAGPEFDGYSAGAIWDDARFGLSHFTAFSKLALVSDTEWIRRAAKLFGPLMPAEVMVFDVADLDDAKQWIKR
jgi:SpoIIAA-like